MLRRDVSFQELAQRDATLTEAEIKTGENVFKIGVNLETQH